MQLRLAGHAEATRSEGPHVRFALWVQGCTLRCPGCCNPEMFEPAAGQAVGVDSILAWIERARTERAVEGITVLGGEPLEQMAGVTAVASAVSQRGLGVIVFTGYRIGQARRLPGFPALWAATDTIVDGRFLAARPDLQRPFVGSTNQRPAHRTGRYADPTLWTGPRTAEVQIANDGSVTVLGAPEVADVVAARLIR